MYVYLMGVRCTLLFAAAHPEIAVTDEPLSSKQAEQQGIVSRQIRVAARFGLVVVRRTMVHDAAGNYMHCYQYCLSTNDGVPMAGTATSPAWSRCRRQPQQASQRWWWPAQLPVW